MSAARRGMVYLVGAGPGDMGLMTSRALELVRSADVLLVDRLIPPALLREARAEAEIIDVGKTAGNHAMPQEQINQRLVEEALRGRSVVRVKGGDPYLFGRGGEEAIRCRAAGVAFEVVPGVTSAFAACAAAGIPVTHRDIARHVTVVTASAGRDGQGDPDYRWLARSDGTIVLLMGLRRVGHVARNLIEAGMDPHTPAAVISRGTTSGQRTVTGTLGTLERAVQRAALASPAIIVVGEVVELREHLDWFEQRPLFGMRIGVTRARAQSSTLVARLVELGADVLEAPTIRIERTPPAQLDALIDVLDSLALLAFTSTNGAEAFFERLHERGLDTRALGGIEVAVVGAATADVCLAHGLVVDYLPPAGQRTSAGLLVELEQQGLLGVRCGVVQGEQADASFAVGLDRLGMEVTRAVGYRTVIEPAGAHLAEQLCACDLVTFTSASTVQHAIALLPPGRSLPPGVSIGPATSAAAQQAGVAIVEQAETPSIEALAAAVLQAAAKLSPAADDAAGAEHDAHPRIDVEERRVDP